MVGEPATTMADKDEILDAIAALAATVRNNHADLMGKIDVISNGTGRVEAELGTVKADMREVQSSVARIGTRLDRHETRIEALEARP
jgi:archaellum component FlaC